MFQTSARMVMSGIAAVVLGAMSGWVLIEKLPKKSQPATARASTVVVPDNRPAADEPLAPSRQASKPSPASPPAAATPAPTRVAAPAPPPSSATPEKESAAKPASSSPAKPQIRLDPDRGEATAKIGDTGITADKKGRLGIAGPGTGFSFDPEEGSFKIRSPKGTFKIDW